MKIPAILLLPLFALPALASGGAGPYSFTLSGKAFDERCLKLAAGESIRYRFRASAPVDFNIHYHRGKDVFFPVKQAAVREAASTFRAENADDYCLMWEHAGTGTSTVEGSIERGSGR
jgi:hypothetical protein